MELFMSSTTINTVLPILAIIAALFVITTHNPIYSVLNLIVLYILVAFYLIFKGIIYIGLSYIIIYVGAIAILFLFILMMIDLEVVERRNNNYLPLLSLLLVGSVFLLKKIVVKFGFTKYVNFNILPNDFFNLVYSNNLEFEGLFNLYNSNTILNELDYLNDDSLLDLNRNIEETYHKLDIQDISESDYAFNLDINNIFQDIVFSINYPIYNSENKIFNKWSIDNASSDSDLLTNIDNLKEKSIDNILETILINKYDDINIHPEITDSFILNVMSIIKDLFLYEDEYYMVFVPNWENSVSRITQISALGDILYSVYHSYIYILSAILLLGMVGAILLTAEKNEEIRFIPIIKKKSYSIPAFLSISSIEELGSEGITDSLSYFVFIVLFINFLLFGINTFLSLSMKYLDKEGGFECGFTSFVQTRERFNIIFYRVALLFLIFDLEIIIIFPYTAINHNNQYISKNNILAFIYILVVGFIFELKEGALEIVKKAHPIQLKTKS